MCFPPGPETQSSLPCKINDNQCKQTARTWKKLQVKKSRSAYRRRGVFALTQSSLQVAQALQFGALLLPARHRLLQLLLLSFQTQRPNIAAGTQHLVGRGAARLRCSDCTHAALAATCHHLGIPAVFTPHIWAPGRGQLGIEGSWKVETRGPTHCA